LEIGDRVVAQAQAGEQVEAVVLHSRHTEIRAYEAEIEQVRGLLLADETIELDVPTVRANTTATSEAYAATEVSLRSRFRVGLFRAYWRVGSDIGDAAVLAAMGLARRSPTTATAWREAWLAHERPLVPIMVLPDGYV